MGWFEMLVKSAAPGVKVNGRLKTRICSTNDREIDRQELSNEKPWLQ